MISLSDRLSMVSSLLGNANVIADVGCDHGYLPIYLLETGAYSSAIAMDVNEGPLRKARENIRLHNLSERIDIRLSDGVSKLTVGEADSISICGMGGNVMMHILQMGEPVFKSTSVIVIQPQSEYALLRKYLLENGYVFDDEDIVFEDGKYYFAWKLHHERDMSNKMDSDSDAAVRSNDSDNVVLDYPDVKFCYSQLLCERGDKVCRDYIESYRESPNKSIQNIQSHSPGNIKLEQLAYECSAIDNIFDIYYNNS